MAKILDPIQGQISVKTWHLYKIETQKEVRSSKLCFDLFKAFDYFESSHKLDLVSPKLPIFLHACATCSGVPSNISTMSSNSGIH